MGETNQTFYDVLETLDICKGEAALACVAGNRWQREKRPHLVWQQPTMGYVTGEPLVQEGRVYIADWFGYIYCIDEESGKIIWKNRLYIPPNPNKCLPNIPGLKTVIGACLPYMWQGFAGTGALMDGIWYLGSVGGKIGKIMENGEPGKLYAVDIKDGSVIWADTLAKGEFSGSLAKIVAYGGIVYVGVSSCDEIAATTAKVLFKPYHPETVGEVIAYNGKTGEKVWSRRTVGLLPKDELEAKGACIWGGFGLDPKGKSLFFGTGNNYGKPASKSSDAIIALDSQNGTFKWQYQVVSDDQWLPLNPKGPDYDFGVPVQVFKLRRGEKELPVVGIGNKNGYYYVFHRESGELIWQTLCHVDATPDDGIRAAAVHYKGKIYVWSRNKVPKHTISICCLDANSGQILWAQNAEGTNTMGAGAIARDVYIIGNYDGVIKAYGLENGEEKWSVKIPDVSIATNIVIGQNKIIVGTGIPKYYGGNPNHPGIYVLEWE